MKQQFLKAVFVLMTGSLIGCGTYEATVHTRSERELAALFDATKGKEVELYVRDTTSGRIETVVVTDLIVNSETASWTGANGAMETILTSMLVEMTCADCKTNAEGGVLAGGLVGASLGVLVGFAFEPIARTNNALQQRSLDPLTESTSTIPISILFGGVLGGVIGGVAGSSSPRPAVWIFQP